MLRAIHFAGSFCFQSFSGTISAACSHDKQGSGHLCLVVHLHACCRGRAQTRLGQANLVLNPCMLHGSAYVRYLQ